MLNRNYGKPFSYRSFYKSLYMKGFKRRKTKARRLQQRLRKLLEREGSLLQKIPKLSLHQSRFLLAECIQLLQQQSRHLQNNFHHDERNNRKLQIISRKLGRHRSESIILKNSLNNLRRTFYEHGIENTIDNKGAILKSQLKELRMLTKSNLKEAKQCFRLTKDIMVYKLRHVRRKSRSKKKSDFEKAIDQFFNAIKIHKKIKTQQIINDFVSKPRSKGPYEVSSVSSTNQDLETKILNKYQAGKKAIIWSQETNLMKKKDSDLPNENLKDSNINYSVYQTKGYIKDLPESKVPIKVFPRKNIDKEENLHRYFKPIPYDDIKDKVKRNNKIETKLKKKKKNTNRSMATKEGEEGFPYKEANQLQNKVKTKLKSKFPKIKMWLGSHKRAPRKSKTVSLEIEHFRHPSDSSNKSYSTVSSINNSKSHSSSYEKFKPPQLNSIIKTKERSDDNIVKTNRVIKPKHFQITKSDDNLVKTNRVITPKHFQITKSDEAVNQSNKIIETKHFKIRSNFNPVKTEFWTSQKGILPTVKSKLTNSMLGRQSIKSFESVGKEYNQPSMSQVAAAVINRLYDGKTISLDETSFQKKVDTSKIHINSFLGKISKLRPADQMNAVWNDLQETYKEMSRSAKTPEDVQKFKKILKWRYIHNVQKLLHHQIKQFKIDLNSGRSELGTRRSQILNRTVRSSNFIPNSNDTSGLFKKVSRMDTPSNKTVHENFVRMQMEMLRSRIFDRDVYGMERMIMGRELPITPKDFEIFEKYKSDPNHYNILILSINKSLSDEKYEEKLPMLERNFQFICNQLEEISRQRRKDNMLTKHDLQKAEDDVVSKISGESFLERIDFNEAFLAKRREVWADYIAKQAKTPTEILLAAARKQKRKAQLAKKAEEREKRNKQDQQVPKRKRSLTALYRAPRKTHRERQAIKEIKEEMEEIEVRKSKRSVTCSCCRRCSRSGVVWTQKCSEDNTEESHICPVLNYDSCS